MKKVRTTIVLPEEDVRLIKMLAATSGLTMSEVVRQSIHNTNLKADKTTKEKGGWRTVVGSLNLGGKEPPARQEIYDRYLKEKFSR